MENVTSKRKRLIKNTLMLYLRTMISMVVALYSVRVILDALGVEDFGIQNVVSGFVSMFSFVTGSMSVVISRFMAIEIEREDLHQLRSIYTASMQIMVLFSILMIVVIETFGVWFLNNEMNISANRISAANWVLQFSAFTLLFSLISIPFDALIISYERMSAFAYISILSSFIKLAIAFLIYYSPIDKLVFYALLLLVQALIIRICYGVYCAKHFKNVRFVSGAVNKPLIKKMLSMAGWDLWAASSFIFKNYGVNIILNIFFGPAVNAARGIAMQINSALTQFSNGFLTALRPQITKTYASGDRDSLWNMVDSGTKFATFLLLVISVPIMLECRYILTLWLGNVPDYTVNFAVLTIILSISEGTLIYTQNAAMMANGNIRKSQFVTGSIQLLNIPLSYLLLKIGFRPEYTIIVAILIAQLCCFIRSSILTKLMGYSTRNFFSRIYLRIIATGIIMALPMMFVRDMMQECFLRLVAVTVVSVMWSVIVVLYVGCNQNERNLITSKIKHYFHKS